MVKVKFGKRYGYTLENLKLCWRVREHQRKRFVTVSGFWPLRGWEGLRQSVKRRKYVTKIFFQIILNKVLKACEK